MQELHLVKSTSFCSSSLILYHLFIPSLLFLLFLLFSALSQAWTEVLRRDEGCCCPLVVLLTLALWPPGLTPGGSTGCSCRGGGKTSLNTRQEPESRWEKSKEITDWLTYAWDSCHSISSWVSENCQRVKRRRSVTKIIITHDYTYSINLFWYNLLARVGWGWSDHTLVQ